MYKNKRKREAFEPINFERNVKTRLTSDSFKTQNLKPITFPKRTSMDDNITSSSLKKSSIRTFFKASVEKASFLETNTSNKLYEYLLQKDKLNVIKGIFPLFRN